jgi:hypothetical protein
MTTYSSKYSNSWALVIGINNYKHISPLDYAANDANAVAKILVDRFGFPESNVTLLLDDKGDRETIRKTFSGYADGNLVQDNDRLLVFFAGHGLTVSGRRGEVGFLVPSDGRPDSIDSLIRWDELTRTADLIRAKHVFFLMDACYGGLAFVRSPTFGKMRFMGDMLGRFARQVLAAGKADEVVSDGNGVRPGHSIFTAHLLNALEGGAATEDGIITASGVMAYVYDRVGRDQYSSQTPHYGFIDGDGEFIFDTSPLDRAKESGVADAGDAETAAGQGEKDILVNSSPELLTSRSGEPAVVEQVKELLSDPAKQIRLDDYINLHIRQLLQAIDLRYFPVEGTLSNDEFAQRVERYEAACKDIQRIVILLAKWGTPEQLRLLERAFSRIAETDKGGGGLVVWLRLSWYPLLYLMYSAGISALASRRFDALRVVLTSRVQANSSRSDKDREPLVVPAIDSLDEILNAFKSLPGHERNFVPRSEHLFKVLQPELEDLLLLGRSYESLFDEFEILLSLVYLDLSGNDWGPIGRFGWKQRRGHGRSPYDQLVSEAESEGATWGPVQAGLFKGDPGQFSKSATALRENLKQLHWR